MSRLLTLALNYAVHPYDNRHPYPDLRVPYPC